MVALVFSLAVKKVAHLAFLKNVSKKGGELKEIRRFSGHTNYGKRATFSYLS